MRRFVALLLLVPAVAVQAATVSAADAAVVAGFEIDGNTGVDGGGLDWASTGTHTTDPTGNADGSNFTGGSKEFQNPANWKEGTGTSTNQGDISDVYSYFASGSESWAFLGFRRLAQSGTMTFMVELNQKPNLPQQAGDSVKFRPNRSVNDLLMRFEQDGNGTFALTHAYKWTPSASGTFVAGCFTVAGYATPSAWCPTSTTASGFAGATGENKLFAEGAVNLSSFDTVGDCRGAFGTMNVRSFAGDSENSSLLDFVGAVGISVPPTCGQLQVNKVDQFGDPVGGATFRITPNPVPGVTGSAASELVVRDGSAQDPDGTADGTVSISPAKPGTYTVEETVAPAGYIRDTTVRTDVVVGSTGTSVASVGFTNPLVFAPPTIDNQVTPTYDVDYGWRVHKSVDRTRADVSEGTTADFQYTVELEALGPPARSGHEIGGTVTVTNPNQHGMVVTLSTDLTGGGACSFPGVVDQSTAAGLQVAVAAGANQFTYACAPGADPADPARTTASIAWDAATYPQGGANPTYTRSDSDQEAFAIDQKTDETTTVTDTFDGGAAEDLGTFTWGTVWAAPGHTVVVKTYTRSLAGVAGECTDHPNVARESADGTSDNASVKVCVGRDLTIDKDASLGFHRTYDWDIAKSGPGTVFVGADAQGRRQTMVTYDVDVTATGYHDSAWSLGGTITVSNPNSWAVTGTITDTVQVDTSTLACTVAGADVAPGQPGHQVTIPAGAVDQPFTYTCAGVQQGDYVGKNTVTIDWSGAPVPSPHTSATKTVDVAVSQDAPTNRTITLTDLLAGDDVTADLPQSTFDWTVVHARPGNTRTISYTVPLGTTADACTPYENVVTIDQTGQHAAATATICSPGVAKTVSADYGRKQLWSIDKQVDKTSVEVAEGGTATFTYTVQATPGAVVDDGTAAWTGTVSVRNPSDDTALTVDVADVSGVQGWTCTFDDDSTAVEVAAGASVTLDYTCAGTGHASGTNTATVSFGQGQSVSRTVDVAFAPRPGIADSTVTVHDDKTDPDAPPVLLGEADASDPATQTFTYSLTKVGVAGACTAYDNTAVVDLTASPDVSDSARATLCVEKPLTADVAGQGGYGITYPWSIDKVLDDPQRVEVDASAGKATFDYHVKVVAGDARPAGWTLSGTVTVDNPNTYADGAITLTGVDVTTDLGGGADCTATLPASPVVAPDGSLQVPFSCAFDGEPSTSGSVSASVTWDPAGAAASATATDSSEVSLSVGRETDKVIDVWDDRTDPEHPVLLEEGLTWSKGLVKTYDYQLTHDGVPGECVGFTNTAWLDLSGDDPSDSTTATVCEEAPLGLAVTGSADLARDYAWSIAKVADATQRTADASGNATFTYTVTARAGAATDSGWQLRGSVQVTNPNQYADGDVTADVTAATSVGGGAACTVTGGQGVVVQEDSTTTLPVACTFSSRPADTGTLSVTATWDPPGEASTASVTKSTPITFAVRSENNKVVQVVDDKTVAGQRVVLDPALTWSEGLVKSYTYALTLAGGAAGACQSHTNTATIDQPVGTDPTASTTVLVCTPVATPPEVLPEQAFGKAVGRVTASCQGTVRARLVNRSGETVTYKLRVGTKVHRITVKSLTRKRFVTSGRAQAKVTLKVGSTRLDKLRIPALCQAPEVLPDTGLRAAEE